jgi:site-specific DNA-methyltransferase (adenine-specific)
LSISEGFSMAMAEYAWTSIPGNAKVFEFAPQDSERFHPTQKPVALYRWLLSKYANPGDTILDTHMGSGSSVVACLDLGHFVTASEISEFYFDKAVKRIEAANKQPRLFEDERPAPVSQELGL